MPIVALIIIQAALEVLLARLLPATMLIGIVGAMIGGPFLWSLIPDAGWMSGFVGAVLGALLVIWIWQTYLRR